MIQSGALAISILALTTVLNANPKRNEFKVRRRSDHNSTLKQLQND